MADKNVDVGNVVRSLLAGTFRRVRSPELGIAERHEAIHGRPDTDPEYSCRLPIGQIFSRVVTVAGGAGPLVASSLIDYAPALQARSVCFRLGATLVPASKDNVTIARGATVTTATYQSNETTAVGENEGAFGLITSTPKYLSVYSKVSRQLLLQSNADQILRIEQTNSAAAAMDAGIIAGTGTSGQPTGIINTAGIGSSTGAVTYATIIAGQQAVSDANAFANPDNVGYLATPTVAGLLKQRYRIATYGETPIWQGPLAGGAIEGVQAFATKNVPASTMIFGDFSAVQVFMWDDATIEVDPSTNFQSGLVGIRLLVPFDVVVRYPSAFSVATAIT